MTKKELEQKLAVIEEENQRLREQLADSLKELASTSLSGR